jgi:hypothetical protein
MFVEPMLRNAINNKVYILTSEFESEGCEGCAFIDDYIACKNVPNFGCGNGKVWAVINLQAV